MSKVMRFYNPKTKQYEPINAGGVLDEDTNEILTGKDINKKADKSYVDNEVSKAGKVQSVNKKQGNVELTSDDIPLNNWTTQTINNKLGSLDLSIYDLEDNKADKSYVDNKISNIDINQFEAVNKGGYSFNNLKESGVYRLWNSSTSPCKTNADYIVVVYEYNNKIIQVAHSSSTSSQIENRVYTRYYAGSYWTSWRELTNVDIEKEIDNLKTSGVEINRILVDALNSKGVWASTSSTIKTNVNKVKNIKVGDYSVGDVIDITKLKPLEVIGDLYKVWEFTGHSDYVNAVAVDDKGYVYSGGGDKKVMKISPSGSKVWEFTGHSGSVLSVAVDDKGYVYSGGGRDDKKVMKISPQGNKVWEFTGHSDSVNAVAVDKDGYVYSGSKDKKVMKISPQGNKVWEFTGHSDSVNAVAVDDKGYVYSGGSDEKVMKISPQGNKVWQFTGHSSWINAVAVDKDGYVYSGGGNFDRKIMKISPQGNKVWEYFIGISIWATALAVDDKGYVYSALYDDKRVMKISPQGNEVWEFRSHSDSVRAVAVDKDGYVYSGSKDEKVMKISPGTPISYKIIA